jgi:hypothetical protein
MKELSLRASPLGERGNLPINGFGSSSRSLHLSGDCFVVAPPPSRNDMWQQLAVFFVAMAVSNA